MTKEEKKRIKKQKIEEKIKYNKSNGKYKKLRLFVGVFLGMFLTITVYLIYNLYRLDGVENIIRYIVMGLLGLFGIFLIIKYLKLLRKPLLSKYIILLFIILVLGGTEYFLSYSLGKGLSVVDHISVKKYKTYSTSIVALKDGKLKEIKDITKDTKIGRVDNKDDIEGYKLTKYLIKKDSISNDSIEKYDDPISMLYDLYDQKIDAVFISGSYVSMYNNIEKFENIQSDTIVLDTYKKKMRAHKSKENYASTKSINEPFTILLMGVDSAEEDLSKAAGLGDSLMLITFNPKTLNTTIMSIPRDTYVPITCYRNSKSKITHAASGGDSCMINTIENFFDINIDYYAKINFRGLMKLVDALGGIDVEVPYSFCETTMWRSEEYMVYVEEGMQHLNGEQALGLSRNRKTYARCGAKWNKGTRNDFVRGQNQQLVINAIINKAKNLNSISQFYGILDAVGNSMTTNMDKKQILSFYNVFKNILLNSKDLTDGNDLINMQKMYLNGTGGLYYDGIMNMDLYEYLPSTQSLNAIKNAMKINLELKNEEPATEFSFSADEDYEPKIIGKDLSGGVEKPTSSSSSTSSSTSVTCEANEELGADKKTCLCKNGYERKNGSCVKQTITCGANEELGSDGVTCVCPTWKDGITGQVGNCKKSATKQTTETDNTSSSSTTSSDEKTDDNSSSTTDNSESESTGTNNSEPDETNADL